MISKLFLPITTALFLLAVLVHLGFFERDRLARGLRNLGILGAEMVPPDFSFFRWRGGPCGKPSLCLSPARCSASSLHCR